MEKFLLANFFDLNSLGDLEIFSDCTYVWEPLEKLEGFFAKKALGKIASDIPPGVHLVNPELITIGPKTIIEPGAFICGPCIIGQGCQIRHGAYIRGFCLIADQCVIGHGTEIKSSILLNKASAAHFNYVGDSILGNGVNLGAGVKLANLRLDHQNIEIFDQGKKIITNLKKMGAVIGDGSELGCNTVTNPGTICGKKSFCYPGIVVGGVIPSNTKVRSTYSR